MADPVVNTANASSAQDSTDDVDIAWSHTVVSGSDVLLLVAVGSGENRNQAAPTSVVFGADTLTQVPSSYIYNTAFMNASWWYKIAPTVQTATITATWAGNQFQKGCVAFQVTGVHQTTPLGTAATNSNTTGTAVSVTVTSAVGETVVAFAATDSETGITEAGTLIKEENNVATDTCYNAQYYTGAASVNAQWTNAVSNGWSASGVSIKPLAAGNASAPMFRGS